MSTHLRTNIQMMKRINKVLLTVAALTFTFTLHAQYTGAKLEYVKVNPGQWDNYLELEKSVQEFHQSRVEKGIITRWALYEKMYGGENDAYDYILVTLNDDFKKTENPFPQEMIDASFTKEEQADFWEKASASRKIVKTEYFDMLMEAEGGKPSNYLRLSRYYVDPGKAWEFENLRKELVKPIFDEVVKRGYNSGWSVWKKDPSDQKFQYVSVNGFADYGDWKESIQVSEIFKDIFPDMDFDETSKAVMGSRTLVSSEYWKLVLNTDPKAE